MPKKAAEFRHETPSHSSPSWRLLPCHSRSSRRWT